MEFNTLSLFGGMECGRIALEKAGIELGYYFSSEIDPYAIKVQNSNYPQNRLIGNVENVNYKQGRLHYVSYRAQIVNSQAVKIDLLIGGSPCQDLRPGRDGLKGSKSKLFYEYLRILNQVKSENPDIIFLFENVCRISNDDKQIITDLLGVKPIRINSALVSAQNRERYYWTNIEGIEQPKDKKVYLKDILEENVPEKYYLSEKLSAYINREDRIRKKLTAINGQKSLTLMAYYDNSKNGTFLCVDCNGRIDLLKSNTLTQRYAKGVENFGGNPFIFNGNRYRKFTPVECERLQTVPDYYTAIVSNTQRYRMLGNGWNVDTLVHIFQNINRSTLI